MAIMVALLAGHEELSYETDLRKGRENVWMTLWRSSGKSQRSKGG